MTSWLMRVVGVASLAGFMLAFGARGHAPANAVGATCGPNFSPAPGSPYVADGSFFRAISASDLNGDASLDLVALDSNKHSIRVLLGNGVGGFSPVAGSPITFAGCDVGDIAVGDLSGDGRPDIVVSLPGCGKLTTLLGDGAGGFQASPESSWAMSGLPTDLVMADVDRDTDLDLAVVAWTAGHVAVLVNDGSGHLSAPATPPPVVGTETTEMVTADFNGDSIPDLALANPRSHDITVLLGDGNGAFFQAAGSPFPRPDYGFGPWTLAAADMNGDGLQDILVGSAGVIIYLGNGLGSFTRSTGPNPGELGSPVDGIAAGDFDGDGDLDLAAVGGVIDGRLTVLLGDGHGGLTRAPGFPMQVTREPVAVIAVDLDHDGDVDLAVTGSRAITVLLNGCEQADLGVAVADSPDPVLAGGSLTYTVTATNAGPDPAAGAALSFPLPSSTTFESLQAPAGWSCSAPAVGAAGTVTCTRPSVPVGSSTLALVVGVRPNLPTGAGLTGSAIITASTPDPNGGNNTAAVVTTVITTPPATDCSPRPRVDVRVERIGGERLRVTVAPTVNNGRPASSNALQAISWGQLANAAVTVEGIGAVQAGQRTPFAPGTRSATFTVGRNVSAQGATVQLTVTDACGDWPTVVGGGPGAF